jgi:hypothetical protein
MGAKARTIESSSSGVIHFLTNQSELNGYPKVRRPRKSSKAN